MCRQCANGFTLARERIDWYTKHMEKRMSYFVSRKNVLTWLAALIMVGSAGLRIAYYCEKGADARTMWWLIILPVAANLIFALIVLLDGKEHFYRTAVPVAMMALYFTASLALRGIGLRYLVLNACVYLAFIVFYKLLTSGVIRPVSVVFFMFLAATAVLGYDSRAALMSRQWAVYFALLPDFAMLLGGLFTALAIRPHLDGQYHPTWGDRSDGRRIRTLSPMSVVVPYIMVNRNGSCNFLRDELEISDLEQYVREKRREGLTNFGLTHVFITAYCRLVAKYPALNRFLAGQRVYSRGEDIQYCMAVKKEMSTDAPDTCIKLHLNPNDTVYDVYRKFNEAVEQVKNSPLDSSFDQTARLFTMLPGLLFKFTVWFLKTLDYFGLIPKFLLEVSPFHGSVFFTSMGSLGIPAIVHHLYDFGNLPVFIAFGCKFRRNELASDGTIRKNKYVDMTFNLDERICDGFYYATALKYLRRVLADPHRLDTPPERVEKDID